MNLELCTVTLEMKSRTANLTRTFFGEPTLEEIIDEFKDAWGGDRYIYEALQECGPFAFATWHSQHGKGNSARCGLLTPTWTSTYMKDGMRLATLTMTIKEIPFTRDGEAKLLQAMADEKAKELEELEALTV